MTATSGVTPPAAPRPTAPRVRAPLLSPGRVGMRETQRVTAKDIEAGRVRLPRAAKSLLPAERGDLDVVFRGQLMRARWDPKTEGPKERSGVLAFGRGKLDGLVKADEVLEMRHERAESSSCDDRGLGHSRRQAPLIVPGHGGGGAGTRRHPRHTAHRR